MSRESRTFHWVVSAAISSLLAISWVPPALDRAYCLRLQRIWTMEKRIREGWTSRQNLPVVGDATATRRPLISASSLFFTERSRPPNHRGFLPVSVASDLSIPVSSNHLSHVFLKQRFPCAFAIAFTLLLQ